MSAPSIGGIPLKPVALQKMGANQPLDNCWRWGAPGEETARVDLLVGDEEGSARGTEVPRSSCAPGAGRGRRTEGTQAPRGHSGSRGDLKLFASG